MYQRISLFFVCIFLTINALAQELGNSPYSKIGLGDLNTPTMSHQEGIGGTGASYMFPFLINHTNSALLSRLSKTRNTIFEAGTVAKLKELKEGDNTQRDFSGNLRYLAIAVPVSSRMGGVFGVAPYTSVNYQNTFVQPVFNSDFLADVTYRGSGGITSLYAATGYEFTSNLRADTLKHRFALGLKVNYLFGAVVDESISKLRTGTNQAGLDYEVAQRRRTSYSDFTFEPSLVYSYKLKNEKRFNVGVVYALGNNLNARRYVAIERRINDLEQNNFNDTIVRNERGRVYLPSRVTFGVSLEKEYKWAVMADVSYQNWVNFRGVQESDTLGRSLIISVGGQFIPNFNTIQRGFWRRTLFQAGFQYVRTPYLVRNNIINEFSARLGMCIPLTKQGSFSMINLALVAGRRGTTQNNLIRENYLRIHLGATINDRWFIKPKFN
ncbi:MAG: hypothetical protein MUE85_12610 [Microscillaceae bacterium]|jgi:hypothetical protein|nr:hypothetical protein [Microscillaceae bacterium]